jgi:hypothetical protein
MHKSSQNQRKKKSLEDAFFSLDLEVTQLGGTLIFLFKFQDDKEVCKSGNTENYKYVSIEPHQLMQEKVFCFFPRNTRKKSYLNFVASVKVV